MPRVRRQVASRLQAIGACAFAPKYEGSISCLPSRPFGRFQFRGGVAGKLATELTATASGEVARELLEEIQVDRRTLEHLIVNVGKPRLDVYDALRWIAERLSRIKLKHDDPYGLGTFEAFETISLGIAGALGVTAGASKLGCLRWRPRLLDANSERGTAISEG